MGKHRLLWLNAVSHALVDGVCAAALFGPLRQGGDWSVLVLIYNTLAFSTQCLVGLLTDRLRRRGVTAALAMAAVALGLLLPLPVWVRLGCLGLGNSFFHVAGGTLTLERSEGRAWPLGLFVAPGAVGLTVGTLWPAAGPWLAALLLLCAALTPGQARPAPAIPSRPTDGDAGITVPLLLTLAVAVRAVGGSAVSFPWKAGPAAALALTACVFAGKALGGFVCDRLGAGKTALFSMLPALVLVAFCADWAAPSLLGQLALNLTMPVTLWLLYRAMPDEPGFAFGLAASALWPGMAAGQLMTLTGPALWLCVITSFGFGLWAILVSEKRIGGTEA